MIDKNALATRLKDESDIYRYLAELVEFDIQTGGEEPAAKVSDFAGQYVPDFSDGNDLADVFKKGFIYSHDTADRVDIASGCLMQRFEPTSAGSHHDQAAARIESGFREYTISQTVKFASDFEAVLGGKFGIGLIGGSDETVSGGNINPAGWSFTHMWRPSKVAGMISLVGYSYHHNRRFNNGGTWGDDCPIGDITLGEWHELKTVLGMNESALSPDGYMRVFLDGELAMELHGVQWQASGFPGENMRAEYKAFFGGNTAKHAPSKAQYMWVKNPLISWRDA